MNLRDRCPGSVRLNRISRAARVSSAFLFASSAFSFMRLLDNIAVIVYVLVGRTPVDFLSDETDYKNF